MQRSPSVPFSALLLLILLAFGNVTHAQGGPWSQGGALDGEARREGHGPPNTRALRDPPPPSLSVNNSTRGPPDVYLRVPELSVKHIGLEVDNLKADVSLTAAVAGIVKINAGVQVGIKKVNISIDDVGARVDLVIRLDSLVGIVNRTMKTLDLNPNLVNLLDSVGNTGSKAVKDVGRVLKSVVGRNKAGNVIKVDDKGNILEEVKENGKVISKIIGDYINNMWYTGKEKDLGGGHVERTYEYKEAGVAVKIVFNEAGKVIHTMVVRMDGEG